MAGHQAQGRRDQGEGSFVRRLDLVIQVGARGIGSQHARNAAPVDEVGGRDRDAVHLVARDAGVLQGGGASLEDQILEAAPGVTGGAVAALCHTRDRQLGSQSAMHSSFSSPIQ